MPDDALQDQVYLSQFRLFLEELCSDLCRFHHVAEDGLEPQAVRISREVSLDAAGSYADIRVQAQGNRHISLRSNSATPPTSWSPIYRENSASTAALLEAPIGWCC